MAPRHFKVIALLIACLLLLGCASRQPITRKMEVTAYCGCKKCCEWSRGSWKALKLNWWDRYVASGRNKGTPYSGLTASGAEPREPHPGLFSLDSLSHPWVIPFRLILFPWLLASRDGTVAADTDHFPFDTRLHIPGYGFGRVQDRGGAIKGPSRLDVYFDSHDEALNWGRRTVKVRILK
jgi:hypothetical protein